MRFKYGLKTQKLLAQGVWGKTYESSIKKRYKTAATEGEEWWRVPEHSSPLGMPINTGVSKHLVKSEEFFVYRIKKKNQTPKRKSDKPISDHCYRQTAD